MKTTPDQRIWVRAIQKGDVLRALSGRLRIVRAVSHYRTGPDQVRTYVTMAIAHQSWTGRPYTVVNGNDLVQAGYRPTGAKSKLSTAFDAAMERSFDVRSWRERPADVPTSRQVIGIP